MSPEMLFVFVILIAAAVLFASNRVRLDIVALLVVVTLMLGQVISGSDALPTIAETTAGFGDSIVLLVAGLLVVGEMLDRTGVAQSIGNWIIRTGGSSETRLLVLIMLAAAVLSSVMSSTAVVAIFIPIVFKVASQTGLDPKRLLMPMSFAAMISGMLTLIATTPNLVVSSELEDHPNYEALGFFSFFPIGAVVLAVGIVYILLVGRRMLGGQKTQSHDTRDRSMREMWEEFSLGEQLFRLRIPSHSPMVGKSVGELDLENKFGIRILMLETTRNTGAPDTEAVDAQTVLPNAGVLVVQGFPDEVNEFARVGSLEQVPETSRDRQRVMHEFGIGMVLIHPDCRYVGKTLKDIDFRSRFGTQVLGIRRGKETLQGFEDVKLAVADTLLVAGPWKHIAMLRKESHDFVLIELPTEYEEARPGHRKAPIAIGILLAMVLLSASGVMPVVVAVMLAALAAISTRCLTMEEAYRSISWSSLVLLAGMLPLAVALQKSGGTDLLVDKVVAGLGNSGPYVMMTVLFFLTAGLSLVLSNTATAVVIAPVAIQAAEKLDVSAYPFAITVLIASSAAFASPVASPVVTLVVEPGNYRFTDFVKVGGPLMLLTYVVTILLTPLLFPL